MNERTAKELAATLGVNVRTVQLWAKAGRLPGARKVGRDWLIPEHVTCPEMTVEPQVPRLHVPMPLMNASFSPGHCKSCVERIKDPNEQRLAWAEYYYFVGQPEKACHYAQPYLRSEDVSLQMSACWIYGYANLSLGHIQMARYGLACVQETIARLKKIGASEQDAALCIFFATATSVLLHLSLSDLPPLAEIIPKLPEGMRLFACYVMAHEAYLRGDYSRSLGLAEAGLALRGRPYPIPQLYLHMVAVMDLMSLKRVEDAKHQFRSAWALAQADDLIECLAEHHGLLQGMIEICLKNECPADYARIIEITYRFSAGWRKIHNPECGESVADNLTTTEFTVAMLAARGWTNQEIAVHLKFSANTVRHMVSQIYSKLHITSRKELKGCLLR